MNQSEQFRSDSLQIALANQITCLAHFIESFHVSSVQCLCNKICFRSLCCPLSMKNYHKLKRIHTNIVQNPTFLECFQTFGGQCKYILFAVYY